MWKYGAVLLLCMVISCHSIPQDTPTEEEEAILSLIHKGGYIARFKVEWDEVKLVYGNEVVTRVAWKENEKSLTAPYETTIKIPVNARNISIMAEERTGLVRESWRKVINVEGLPLVPSRSVTISGTTLNPKLSVDPPITITSE